MYKELGSHHTTHDYKKNEDKQSEIKDFHGHIKELWSQGKPPYRNFKI